MSKIELLRLFLNERLTAAAEEIFGVVEKTIAEYQGEVVRLQSLLDFVVQPKIKQHKADVQQLTLSISELETTPQLHQVDENWIGNLRSEDTELTQIKEELWTSPRHSYQAQKEGSGEGYSLPTTTTEQIKIEPYDEDYRESESTSVSQTLSAENPECSAAQSENSQSAVIRENEGPSSNYEPVKSKRTKMLKGQSSYSNSKGWKSTQLSLLKTPSQNYDTTCSCKVCGRFFHQMGSLFKHVQTHTKDKEKLCGVCGRNMESSECMKDHLQTHIAARYCCHVCGKWFTFNSNLKTHMRSHTGEKPYRCPYCCKGFITGGDLKKHIRIHTGEKPFCCPGCGKSFTRSGHLKRHMKTHTVDK